MIEIWIFQNFDFSGRQKQTSLAASDRLSIMEIPLRVGDMVLVDNKDKGYVNNSVEYGYVTV